MKKNLKASVIIPNFNGEGLLRKNLPHVLKAFNNEKNRILEVIVVDDASVDDSVKLVKTKFTNIKIVKHKKNRGFSASVNTGARSSKGSLIVLLNSDVKPANDFLASALRLFEERDVFAVSFNEKKYAWTKGVFEDGFVKHSSGKKRAKVVESFWASGGSAVFRRKIWMKLKGMDEELFKFYWDDIDLCYRAQKRGLKVLWDPEAIVDHKHESTTGKVFSRKQLSRMQEINQLIFIWKNITSNNLFARHLRGLLTRLLRHPGYIRVFLSALVKLNVILKKRRIENKECKISDEAIFAKFS